MIITKTPPQKEPSPGAIEPKIKTWVLVGYALQISGFSFFFTLLIAMAVNYYWKPKAKGTIAESHLRFQRSTFWYVLVTMILGVITAYFYVGYLLLILAAAILVGRSTYGIIRLRACLTM